MAGPSPHADMNQGSFGEAARRHARDGGAPADRQRVRRTCSGGRVSTARRAATIGVYDWTLEAWLDALRATRVAQVLDVRQRRGVRGSRYAWANSARLQAALAEAGIEYRHHEELAPTTELRQLQYAEDDRVGVGKRSRVELTAEYRRGYIREILDQVGPTADRRGDAGRWRGRAHVRRGRSRGLPPFADRRAPGGRVQALGGAPAALASLRRFGGISDRHRYCRVAGPTRGKGQDRPLGYLRGREIGWSAKYPSRRVWRNIHALS